MSVSTGVGSLTGLNAITWSSTAGVVLQRRGLFINTEPYRPHFALNPTAFGNEPIANQMVEGEFYYSGVTHGLIYNDGGAVLKQLVPQFQSYMSADSSNITSTTGAAISGAKLIVTMSPGEIWQVEWLLFITFSVTTATLVILPDATSLTAGTWNVASSNGAPDGNPTAKFASSGNLSTTIGATTAIGNPGSTTKPVCVKVKAILECSSQVSARLLLGSSSGYINVKKYSFVKAQRLF